MPSRPTVTWMIPVLNGLPFIRETLASIQQQTFGDFQIVVWDNGSTDGTLEELARWIPRKLPGRIVTGRPMPLGLSRAAMVSECDTELCALIDADDVNHPDRLEKQVRFLAEHPTIAVVGTQLRRLSATGEDQGLFTDYPLDHSGIVQKMLIENPIGQPSVLFRRSAVMAVGNYHDFSPTHVEDYDLWLRLAAAGSQLANLPEALLNYRVHDQSTTQRSIKAQRLDDEMIRRLCEASPQLYGCDASVMQQLRRRQHPRAIVPLRQIATKIGGTANPWKSSVFYDAARQMIGADDIRSRIAWARENRGILGAVSELASVSRYLAGRLKSKMSGRHTALK